MMTTRTPLVFSLFLLALTAPGEFHAPALHSLALSSNPGTRSFADERQRLLAPAGNRWPLKKLLAAKPNAAKGKAAFEKVGCIACHVVRGEGLDFGPELSAIGSKLDAEQLFAAIQKPSQTISLGYEGVSVELKDGTELLGFVTSENKTTLTLRIPGDLRRAISLANIKSRRAMKFSLMPAGFDTALTSHELVDLVGWLQSLRPDKK